MSEEQQIPDDVRALDVVLKQSLIPHGEGPVHRLDSENGCANTPSSTEIAYTDLETAAVNDQVYLCKDCEWPDQADEVVA